MQRRRRRRRRRCRHFPHICPFPGAGSGSFVVVVLVPQKVVAFITVQSQQEPTSTEPQA